MDRRGFIGSAATSLALAGCASLPREALAPSAACLPRVTVAESRVIRRVAGLRPYRRAGFVVRTEALGTKRLVHNYGHGGSGITLSWGTSRLAADLGLAGSEGPVAVLGAGIMGLSTARLAQERGRKVTIYTAALPPETTSNIAGGQIKPALLYRGDAVDDAWRAQFAAALEYSWRRFQIMIGDDYGVRWVPTYQEGSGPARMPDNLVHAGQVDIPVDRSPFAGRAVRRFETMYVETGRYLRRMTQDVLTAGGAIEVRAFGSRAEIAGLPESVVFNCTGLGARELFGDDQLIPMRGQLAVLLPQPEIDYAYEFDDGYMFPRPDGLLLGGTYERGEERAETTPEAIARILAAHARINAAGCAS
ncbi:FAD-dependent oxidoreductase [Novosphingobium sp. PC22D]|uniref:FAD-dependent oxidoreductase n=1 Tax=Novosphingobium sp. PC22D TaxID=1962403 RepID=UPI000BF02A39|nr:FAD-dependent oxidoreductase [Novosphingobium sp. PC22D]PEQ11334.1 FAD-dependent oxidoreductase [Novosphingobium sp. PC22D]